MEGCTQIQIAEKIEDTKKEIGVLRFKMKRAQYADHLIDMDNYEAMIDLKQEKLQTLESKLIHDG